MKRLAVIPARAGSTRLKDKNIYPLGGKPLIRWITEAVIESNCFDKIIISTDSDKIYDAVEDLSVSRHVRNPEYATEKSTVLDAMLDLMSESYTTYDEFAYFLPTCPFIKSEDIVTAVDMLSLGNTLVSMTEIQETIQLACIMNGTFVLPVFDNLECGMTNSKFIKKYYKPSGAFYMGQWAIIEKDRNFFRSDVRGIVIPPERSIDINTLADIQYAETYIK